MLIFGLVVCQKTGLVGVWNVTTERHIDVYASLELCIFMFFHLFPSLHKEEATARCCMAMPFCSGTLTLAWWVKSQYTYITRWVFWETLLQWYNHSTFPFLLIDIALHDAVPQLFDDIKVTHRQAGLWRGLAGGVDRCLIFSGLLSQMYL